jgi:plasmid stabilization system protein ParE
MSWTLQIRPEASQDLYAAATYYQGISEQVHRRFLYQVDSAMNLLMEAPLRPSLWRAGKPYRRVILRVFPYSLFYTVEQDTVTVMALAHHRARPGAWLRR